MPRAVFTFLDTPRKGTYTEKLRQQDVVDKYGGYDDNDIFHGYAFLAVTFLNNTMRYASTINAPGARIRMQVFHLHLDEFPPEDRTTAEEFTYKAENCQGYRKAESYSKSVAS
jgi:hypothetical protein